MGVCTREWNSMTVAVLGSGRPYLPPITLGVNN